MSHPKEGGSFKYIGESARSAYERGANHLNDRKTLDLGSHMLKHALQCHEKEDPHGVKFHMKVLEYHKSSLERQISEAVLIQEQRKSGSILNSKSEYNRSSIPRLGVKMGHKAYKTRKEFEEEVELDDDEKIVEDKIRKMRQELGKKDQKKRCKEKNSAPKRRRTSEEYQPQRNATGDYGPEKNEKRKDVDETNDEVKMRKKRKYQTVMDKFLSRGEVMPSRCQDECQADQTEPVDGHQAEPHECHADQTERDGSQAEPHDTAEMLSRCQGECQADQTEREESGQAEPHVAVADAQTIEMPSRCQGEC